MKYIKTSLIFGKATKNYSLHSAFAVLPHRPHFTPILLCFLGVSAVPTYAVIPAENTCSLSAVYW